MLSLALEGLGSVVCHNFPSFLSISFISPAFWHFCAHLSSAAVHPLVAVLVFIFCLPTPYNLLRSPPSPLLSPAGIATSRPSDRVVGKPIPTLTKITGWPHPFTYLDFIPLISSSVGTATPSTASVLPGWLTCTLTGCPLPCLEGTTPLPSITSLPRDPPLPSLYYISLEKVALRQPQCLHCLTAAQAWLSSVPQ